MSRPLVFTVEVTKHDVAHDECSIGTVDFLSYEEAEKFIASLPESQTAELWAHPELDSLCSF